MVNHIENAERITQCIDISLSQLKKQNDYVEYPITSNDLITWHHCPLCISKQTRSISEVYLNNDLLFFSTNICEDCLHIFRATSPNAGWFAARWLQISTGEPCVYNPSLEEKRKIRYELYYGILQNYKSSGLLLDIGAAYGAGTNVFLQRGFQAEALEPEHDRAEYIRNVCAIPVHSRTIEKFEPESKKYDVILFSHCLEHLDNPLNELNRVKNWLNDDGILYVEVPIAWQVIDWQDSLFMAHKHNFTEANLKRIMSETGYTVISSFLIPDNDGAFCNLALVAVKQTNTAYKNANCRTSLLDPIKFTINDLASMYRIKLPISEATSTTLKYSVPYINHFYHILRKDRNSWTLKDGYITYC